jgi:SAM-dependent methyltransferase
VQFVQADVRQLPFPQDSFDVVLDRGCFHYLQAADRPGYATEVERVLRPDGRFLLRACLYAQGIRNDLTEALSGRSSPAGASSASNRPRSQRHPADDRLGDSTGAPKT